MTGILDDFLDRPQLAAEFKVTPRTLNRWENQPNGLPSVVIGVRKFYRREAVMAWVKAKERKPNPRRSA